MKTKHPFYQFFDLESKTEQSSFYVRSNIKVHVFRDNTYQINGLSISNSEEDNPVIVSSILFKNEEEMLFILDRIPEVRVLYPSNIGLPTIVQTFGQS